MMEQLMEMARLVAERVSAIPPEERGRKVGMGADGTPTSYVDRVAEDAVLEYMDARGVEANLLSEEAGFVDRGYRKLLVIDPVDGTFNASRGLPFYSFSAGVGTERLGDLEEALVMNLVSGTAYHARRGGGAFVDDCPVSVRTPESGEDMVLMAYMGSHASPRTYELASRFRRVRALGAASLDLCMVAAGQADAYFLEYLPMEHSLRVMDIAAAVLILREGGGEAYTPEGEILDMPLSLDVRKNIMAAGSDAALEMMRS